MPEKLLVRTQSLPDRCEICHQADCYDPARDYCSRCSGLNIEKVTKKEENTTFRNFAKMGLICWLIIIFVGFITSTGNSFSWFGIIFLTTILIIFFTLRGDAAPSGISRTRRQEIDSGENLAQPIAAPVENEIAAVLEEKTEPIPQPQTVSSAEEAESSPVCPRCLSSMEEGFISDFTQEKNKVDIRPGEWIEGRPEFSSEGIRVGGKRQLRISTYRCIKCGYLEFYAR